MMDDAQTHRLRAEITVAVAILDAERMVLGDNVSHVTFAFEAPGLPPPRTLTDAEINASLGRHLNRVMAAIRVVMPQVGLFELEGTVDEPMTANSHETGRADMPPVVVYLDLVEKART